MVRVLIVEDHSMVAQALQIAFERAEDIEVMGSAGSGAEALELAKRLRPDVVLMDYRLPDIDGITGAQQITSQLPHCKVLILTASTNDDLLRRAISAGCSGLLTKSQSVDQVIAAVRAAHHGEVVTSPLLLSRLIGVRNDRTRIGYNLTAREVEVLELMAEGLSNSAIAVRLGIRLPTVRNHVQRVLNKLYAHSRLEAVTSAARAGIIQLDAVREAR